MEESKKRKDERIEKKKKKIKAFLEISKLNDNDRKMIEKAHKNEEILRQAVRAHSDLDSEDTVGPSRKKARLNEANGNLSDECIKSEPCSNEDEAEDSTNPFEGKNLRDTDISELRRLLKQRYKAIKSTPLLRLRNPSGENAHLNMAASNRVPLFLADLQHLALSALLARSSPYQPRWCVLDRAVSVSAVSILFIENVGLSDFLLSEHHFTSLSESIFPFQMEVLMPSAYSGNLVQEFFGVPLSHQECSRAVYRFGSLEAAAKGFDVFRVLRAIFSVKHEPDGIKNVTDPHKEQNVTSPPLLCSEDKEFSPPTDTISSNSSHSCDKENNSLNNSSLPLTDRFPRTQLLLSAWQMLEEGYPMPISPNMKEKYKDFVATKHQYKEVSNHSPMYGVDCEMCITTSKENECTRVSIVNEKLETVLDTLVMPYNRITNYLTKFSGITPAMMEGVTTRLEDVQKFIQDNIEPDAIFVGQSLNFDLIALKMFHPYVIDTSIIFNTTGDRFRKSKLRLLTQMFLKEDIQAQSDGHCSVEDSSASLRLVQLKLSNSIDFGDMVLQGLRGSSSSPSEDASKTKKAHYDRKDFVKSFFSYVPNSTIVGMPEMIEKYVDFLNPKLTKYVQDDGSGSSTSVSESDPEPSRDGLVTCVIAHQIDAVAKVMANKALQNKFCVGHVKLSEEESAQLAAGRINTVKRLNKWVEQIHNALPMNGMCLIVLCGLEKSSNGVCCISLKTKKVERVNLQLSHANAEDM